jgi:hypothetical protein
MLTHGAIRMSGWSESKKKHGSGRMQQRILQRLSGSRTWRPHVTVEWPSFSDVGLRFTTPDRR